MKRFFTKYWGTFVACILIISIVSLFVLCVCVIVHYVDSKHYHVHFLDTNECFDVKRTDVYECTTYIYFNDGSEIKCGSDNVVVFVNKTCSYCGAVYEK